MNRKYIVQKYFIVLLEVITQMWDSDDFYFVAFFFPAYLPWPHVTSCLQKTLTHTLKGEPRQPSRKDVGLLV